jgi:ceramide glucosyltransferase
MISRIAFGVALCSLAYGAGAIAALRSFARRTPDNASPFPADATPRLTILKPVRGREPDLFENLSSFCDQDYPNARVIFGVRDLNDPAIPVILKVLRTYPSRDLLLIVDARVRARNPKIANILNLLDWADGEILVIADSDVRVDPHYLAAITAPFAHPKTGAVTCLYRGEPAANVASKLGAMIIDDHFAPSVLVAAALGPVRFCLGATMAVRRQALDDIGGIQTLGPHLADDHQLGKLIAACGWRVVLSSYVVATAVAEPDLSDLWSHQVRWTRTVRAVRPLGYSLSFIQYTLPVVALCACLLKSPKHSAALIALAAGTRLISHTLARRALQITRASTPALIPLCDALALAAWFASFFGRDVAWRGERFQLAHDDMLAREPKN